MQNWIIYLPTIASVAAVAVGYAFLKSSARQLQRHREALRASQAGSTEKVHDALKPLETALEAAVREIIVNVERERGASERSKARPYA